MLRVVNNLWSKHKLFIAIFLFAIFLRLYYYVGILRGDDIGYYFLAHQLANNDYGATSWGGAFRIGLYYPVSLLLRFFGSSEFVATLFPLFSSLLSIIFIYGIAKILGNDNSSLLAAFLWAIFPLDVFLATQLMPDGPAVMASLGAIFFFLSALKTPGLLGKLTYHLACFLFLWWAFLLKESMIIIAFVILALVIYFVLPLLIKCTKQFSSKKKRVLPLWLIVLLLLGAAVGLAALQSWPITINNLELTSSDVSLAWFLGRNNPVQNSDIGAGYWIIDRPLFEPNDQEDLLTSPLSQRIRVFDTVVPLFLASAVYVFIYGRKEFYVPIIWFFILLFYLEWGSFPRGLSFPGFFLYTPVIYWIDPRNFHVLSPPALIIIGMFISELFPSGLSVRSILLIMGLTTLAAFGLNSNFWNTLTIGFIHFAILICIAGGFGLVFLFARQKSEKWNARWLLTILLVGLSIASLLPIPHFNVSDYFKEQARRQNLRDVLSYLDTQPSLPISGDGAVSWLDVYSGFELGYDHLDQGLQYPDTRVTKDPSILYQTGGFRVLYGCNQPVEAFEDWPFMEFGDSIGPKTCVSLVRIFPSENLASELTWAKEQSAISPTKENIDLYLAAAMQSQNLREAISALANYATYFPNQAPIIEASSLIAKNASSQLDTKTINLLNIFANCESECSWELGPLLTSYVDLVEGQEVLSVNIDKKTDDSQSIDIPINLNSDTAYILQLELRSFAPFDLVRFDDVEIPDSYPNSWNRQLEWTKYTIVFVTPHWTEGSRDVVMELARVYDRGNIDFRQVVLTEINGPDK